MLQIFLFNHVQDPASVGLQQILLFHVYGIAIAHHGSVGIQVAGVEQIDLLPAGQSQGHGLLVRGAVNQLQFHFNIQLVSCDLAHGGSYVGLGIQRPHGCLEVNIQLDRFRSGVNGLLDRVSCGIFLALFRIGRSGFRLHNAASLCSRRAAITPTAVGCHVGNHGQAQNHR